MVSCLSTMNSLKSLTLSPQSGGWSKPTASASADPRTPPLSHGLTPFWFLIPATPKMILSIFCKELAKSTQSLTHPNHLCKVHVCAGSGTVARCSSSRFLVFLVSSWPRLALTLARLGARPCLALRDGSMSTRRSTTRRADDVQGHDAQKRIHSEVVRLRKRRIAHPRDLCKQRTRGRPEGRKMRL